MKLMYLGYKYILIPKYKKSVVTEIFDSQHFNKTVNVHLLQWHVFGPKKGCF